MKPRKARFEVYAGLNAHRLVVAGGLTKRGKGSGPWRWRLIARNGEITASGEGYATRSSATRGTKTVARLAVEALSAR